MIIQHNLSAMVAGDANLRNLAGIKKRTEKLSTGYKINRAADNAAGLGISEKMRSQIRGLSQATSNANDAISLVQTAEGALQETENVLQRMRELAVQSANGTYTDDDREQIDYEVDALKKEIDRIAESTEFNTMKLLNGGIGMKFEGKHGAKSNEYGALYGSINEDLAIGGGKIYVTSDIQGMYLKFTTGASGKGGENAFYDDNSMNITINLVEGENYTDDQIQKLIDNANIEKCASAAGGAMTFRSEVGQIKGAEAITGGSETYESYEVPVDISTVTLLSDSWGVADSDGVIIVTNDSFCGQPDQDILAFYEPYTIRENQDSSINIYLNQLNSYTYKFTPKDPESEKQLKFIHFALVDNTNTNGTTTIKRYVEDEGYIYKTIPNKFEFMIEDDVLTVYMKNKTFVDSNSLMSMMKEELSNNGYDYKITADVEAVWPLCDFSTEEEIQQVIEQNPGKVHLSYRTYNTGSYMKSRFSPSSTSPNNEASTIIPSMEYFGTIPGIRQVAEGDLSPLLIQEDNGTEGSSDYITFTADTYGKAEDYGSVVKNFVISTEQDMSPGKETVEIDEDTETATLHLATGTRYTNEDIERLLSKKGLNYKVALTDRYAPDGSKDGSVYFNTTGQVYINQTVAGQGVGIETIADKSDRIIFQIGANGTEDQQVGMDIVNASCAAIGVADVDVSKQDEANKAIEDIDKAITIVSTYRAKMGALQNRMEKSVNSLNTANENLSDAESRIRDTDVASEMVEYQKNNILQQASQSMLAQANQQPNGILSLLG